jgi:hypothetical protein
MAFLRNILSNKRVNVDMEVGMQLDEMETDDGPTHSFNPDSMYALNRGSTSLFSFPAPNAVPNAPLLSPAQIERTITNGKRSQDGDRITKVRVVEQESKISTIVCLYFNILKFIAWVSIESGWKAI